MRVEPAEIELIRTLVRPNIPAGKQIDAKLHLKSISPAGIVYIRLLEELRYVNKNTNGAPGELLSNY